MRIINAIVDALRRLFRTDKFPEIDSVEIWEESAGRFKFRVRNITWGSFPTRDDAERVAKNFNFIKTEKNK